MTGKVIFDLPQAFEYNNFKDINLLIKKRDGQLD